VKAITICQPYAHLIMEGRKTCENRTWPTNYRGPIYIHAGKSRSWLDIWSNGGEDFDHESRIPIRSMDFGAVIAIAELVACIHIESKLLPEWRARMTEEQQHHVNGPWCWILSGVVPVGPWPWRGAQGLFEINPDALSKVATEAVS